MRSMFISRRNYWLSSWGCCIKLNCLTMWILEVFQCETTITLINSKIYFFLDTSQYCSHCLKVNKPSDSALYYILKKEIQNFLVKIKVLFLRSLEIFISSREINLCGLDTFSTMVANRPVMYNRVPAFGLLWILLSLQLQLYTSLK